MDARIKSGHDGYGCLLRVRPLKLSNQTITAAAKTPRMTKVKGQRSEIRVGMASSALPGLRFALSGLRSLQEKASLPDTTRQSIIPQESCKANGCPGHVRA
jgi:hypothetical protein